MSINQIGPVISYDALAALAVSINETASAQGGGGDTAIGESGGAAQSLLTALPDILPEGITVDGHVTTSDQAAVTQLTAFLKTIPGAEDLVAAVGSGKVSDDQYANIQDLLTEQTGATGSGSPTGLGDPGSPADPAEEAIAEEASQILSGLGGAVVANTAPSAVLYRFTFDGPEGQILKPLLERSRGGCVIDGDDAGQEVDAELFDKAMRGEPLTREEYCAVWNAIQFELLGRNRGEWNSDVSQRLDKEVLQGDETTGYIWEKGDKLMWTSPDGVDLEIDFPRNNDTEGVPTPTAGFCIRGMSEEFNGAYSIPDQQKRDQIASLLAKLPEFEGQQGLIDAVKSGKLTGEQRYALSDTLDRTANYGLPSTSFSSMGELIDAMTAG